MSNFLENTVSGFHNGINTLNKITKLDILKDMCLKTVEYLLNERGIPTEDEYMSVLSSLETEGHNGLKLLDGELQNGLYALLYLFRQGFRYGVKGSDFQLGIRKHCQLGGAQVKCLSTVYESALQQQQQQQQGGMLFSLPFRLKRVDWKLSVRLGSSECKDLGSPCVLLTLVMTRSSIKEETENNIFIETDDKYSKKHYSNFGDALESSGCEEKYTLEMSIEDFQKVQKHFREIQSMMSMLQVGSVTGNVQVEQQQQQQ